MQKISELTGQLLLATPSLQDPNFSDSVILICHHDDEGCMGLIVNRPQEISLSDVLNDLGIEQSAKADPSDEVKQRVYEGGPVDAFRGFVLHDGWHIYESTMQISEELHLTSSRDVLEELARGEGPEHYMFILGYAGWSAGQLEQELSNNDWIIAPVSHHILFQEPPEMRWSFGARCMGINRSQLSSQVGHA
ncbi:YqgE/AlgH family protein [Mariprofundus sp. KV]|uniref:YqgE/AlgH family protein n=1 Tax=Mariprofundus sp. KV TaxID=2608715 RepID=UPI0015A48F90|nr:YqgE/AlgH family protein [Mariprofundus sp. KV]